MGETEEERKAREAKEEAEKKEDWPGTIFGK